MGCGSLSRVKRIFIRKEGREGLDHPRVLEPKKDKEVIPAEVRA